MDGPVTAKNYVERMVEYAWGKYGDLLAERAGRCPYHFGDNEYADTQADVWATHTAANPETGIPILAEFADRFVADRELASKIRRAAAIVCGEFEVTEDGGSGTASVREVGGGTPYRVICGTRVGSYLVRGLRFVGMMHPWEGDGTHMLCGALTITWRPDWPVADPFPASVQAAHERLLRGIQDDKESISVTPSSRLAPALKKYPADWTEEICSRLGINHSGLRWRARADAIAHLLTSDGLRGVLDGLSGEETACLRYVVGSGGSVKYGAAQRRFGTDDTTLDWSVEPRSTIGSLRRTGILLVGRQMMGSRGCKVVIVASDVLANLRRMGFPGGTAARPGP